MNRFVPLHYEDFKRFVFQLKKRVGLRHRQALEMASKACGFRHFAEINFLHRDGQPQPVPATSQCAGDVGFNLWCAQMHAEFGADLQAEMGADLRRWYSRVFEPCVASVDSLPALGGADEDPHTEVGSTVLVTYRRRRHVVLEAPSPIEACHEA